jgi:hypothetical protein
MSTSAMPPHAIESFERPCPFCGCHFSVTVAIHHEQHALAEYFCPECGRPEPFRAAEIVNVTMVSPRSDGRSVRWRLPGVAESTWKTDEEEFDLGEGD